MENEVASTNLESVGKRKISSSLTPSGSKKTVRKKIFRKRRNAKG